MIEPCKHGNFDGALHRPCYQCKNEALDAENNAMRAALAQLVEAANKTAALLRELAVECDGDYDDAEELENAVATAERQAMYAGTIGTGLVATTAPNAGGNQPPRTGD